MTEDDDDDVSFLAPPSAPNPEEEWEEEVDNVSPLAAESMPKNEHGVDHLEGMTAEIFGDDDEFVQWDRESHDMEEEVEALPDAHYGLLGSRKVLLKPEGCMDDLPEEVLRQILCLVTAQDLYRCVSLVCHHWRNIVQDTKVQTCHRIILNSILAERCRGVVEIKKQNQGTCTVAGEMRLSK